MATAMMLEKPVFGGFGLMAWPMLTRRFSGRRLYGALALCAGLPWAVWGLWFRLNDIPHKTWHPSFASLGRQAAFLGHHPLHVLGVMVGYLHYLIDDNTMPDFVPHRINGRWTTLLFSNCWFELPMTGYLLAIAGLALALAAAMTSSERTTVWRGMRWAKAAAVIGVAMTIPMTIMVLYFHYTPVGAPAPFAVQGRYHAVPLLALLVLALGWLKRSSWAWRGAPMLAGLACAMLLGADGYALWATWHYYWL
jgi:hypothetical protein